MSVRKKIATITLTLVVALLVSALGGCILHRQHDEGKTDDANKPQVVEVSDTKTQDEAAPKTTAPEVNPDTANPEEVVCGFVRAWGTTVSVDPNDDTKVENIDGWLDNTLAYVAPDSELYSVFMSSYDDGGLNVIDAATVVNDVKITGQDGNTYTVVATMAGTQSGSAGWTKKTYEATHVVTLDENNKVIAVDEWG